MRYDRDFPCCDLPHPSILDDSADVVVTFKDGTVDTYADIRFEANRMRDGFLEMETYGGEIFHVVDARHWQVTYK